MTIIFITGANKGLGRESARRLIELGHSVLVGARDPEQGAEAAATLGARFVPIDVTDDASVTAAAADVAEHEGSIAAPLTTWLLRSAIRTASGRCRPLRRRTRPGPRRPGRAGAQRLPWGAAPHASRRRSTARRVPPG